MRIDDLSAPSGRFVARVSASVTTVDRCPSRGRTLPAADNDSLRSSPYPPRSAWAPQKPLLPRRPSPSRLLQRSPTQETDAVETTGPTTSAPASPGSPASRRWSRRGTASPPGHAGVQQQQLVLHPLLSTMALGPAGPLDHLPGGLTPRPESPGRGRVRPPPRPLLLPPRRSRRCQYRPTATAQSLWELLSYDFRLLLATHRLHRPSWMPLATLLNCSSLVIPSRVFHMPIGSDNSRMSRRATPQSVTSPSTGRRPCQPTFCRVTLRTTNRLYRQMRIGAAQRKLSQK